MSLQISASNLITKHFLAVRSDGVKFCEVSAFGGARRFRFAEIECILLAPDHKLSFQVGKETFSIPTNPNNAKHQTVIAALVQEVQRAATASSASGG
jgi:hypothetical protein